MTRETLLSFINTSVRVMTDGKESLAILRVNPQGELTLTAHCFIHAAEECPMIVHTLTEEEMHSIHLEGTVLVGAVSLRSATAHRPPAETVSGPDLSIQAALVQQV